MQQSRFCQTKLRSPAPGARRIFPGQAQRESRVFWARAFRAPDNLSRVSRQLLMGLWPTVKH
jgi:hypothetical protein